MGRQLELARALSRALALKDLPRSGWVREGLDQPESVAAHSWGLSWLVLCLCPAHLDLGRALAMAVLHDLGEVVVGDITPADGVAPARKSEMEERAVRSLLSPLGPRGEDLLEIWREFEEGSSAEARLVRALDKLDMGLQARIYARDRGLAPGEFVESAARALAGNRDWAWLLALLEADGEE